MTRQAHDADIEGDTRIDCLNNMTALVHGHADPDVNRALHAQIDKGVSFSEPAEPEAVLLGSAILVAVANELRRATGKWHRAKYGVQLWQGE